MILNDIKYFTDTNSVEAMWVDTDGISVKCHSYSDSQMDILRIDLGADVAQYESMISEVELNAIPPIAKSMDEVIQHFTDMTTEYIESKVQAYNQSNGLAFVNIDAFPKYAINAASQHHAIANQFIIYADKVWGAVRAYQATLTAIPTDAEFKAILDGVVF